MPIIGFLSGRDPRWLSTLEEIEKELVSASLVYRYRLRTAADDGLPGKKALFRCVLSGMWNALQEQGN